MAITRAEIDEMKANANAAGFGADGSISLLTASARVMADTANIQSDINDTSAFLADDIERIEFEGQVVLADGSLTETERRNIESRLSGDRKDSNALAEKAGILVSGIETTGLGAKEKEKARLQAKARADAFARDQQLLALQAMLDALDREIGELNDKISDFEDKHLTPEQRAYYDTLPADEKFAAKDKEFREQVKNGEMTQEEYDNWRKWNETSAELQKDRERVENVMKHGTDAEIQAEAETGNLDSVRESRDEIRDLSLLEDVETTLIQRDNTGNADLQNDQSDNFGLSNLSFDDAFGTPSGSLSTAHALGGNNPLRDIAPPVKPAFETASSHTAIVKPDATIELSTEREPANQPPANTLG